MYEKEKLKEPLLYINDNVTGFKKFGLFYFRNLVEGAVCAIATWVVIQQIPFVPKVRIIVSLCLCATVFLLNIKGIHNQSLTEVLINTIRESAVDKEYHMRCINENSKENGSTGRSTVGQSIADKAIIWIKETYTEYRKTGEFRFRR